MQGNLKFFAARKEGALPPLFYVCFYRFPGAQMTSGKSKAFILHLCVSGITIGLAAATVLRWYTYTFLQLAGGTPLLLLLVGVDAVLGPFLTLIVYRAEKTKKEKVIDITVIGVLQISALLYGLWTFYVARPVYLIFEYQRMALVTAADLTQEDLQKAPAELRKMPVAGPQLLSLRDFKSAAEQYDSVMLAMSGQSQAAQPNLWQSYEAGRVQLLEIAKPLSALSGALFTASRMDTLVAQSGLSKDQLKYLPLLARQGDWIILIDSTTAEPKGILALDGTKQ
ncbi:MAG: pilus assembly protein [Alcaligenaceae bacterium]|nr:MAG: pilus assembly protein [Alcaligenaceae bacterium]